MNRLVTLGLALFVSQAAIADPKELYEIHCGTCHQMDGGGVPMMQPELISSPRANGAKGGVIDMILKGSAALSEPGDYMSTMPGFEFLTDKEIASIASYVRTNFENTGGPVTALDVSKRRK